MDFRAIANAVDLIKQVAPVATVVPPKMVLDPLLGGQVQVPGYTMIAPPLADLPAEFKTPDGTGLKIGASVGLLWGAVWQIMNREQRVAVGRVTVTSGIWLAGSVNEVTIAWDTAPLALPKDGIVTTAAAISWLGRTSARIKPGSITATDCKLQVTALAAVSPNVVNPITYEVQAPYDYYPPYVPS